MRSAASWPILAVEVMPSTLFEALKRRLRSPGAPSQAEPADARLATAVLLHEVAQADFENCPLEVETVVREIAAAFALPAGEAEALREAAAAHAAKEASLHHVLATLNARLDAGAKRELIARLWRVAYADGVLDPKEEALIRRLADLLFVPHSVFVQERLKAEASAR